MIIRRKVSFQILTTQINTYVNKARLIQEMIHRHKINRFKKMVNKLLEHNKKVIKVNSKISLSI